MKFLRYISLTIFAACLFAACSGSLSDVNDDPTRLGEVDLRLLLPEVEAQAAFNAGATPGRLAGIIMQQFVGLDAQQLAYNSYLMGEDAVNNYWRTGLYAGVLKSAQVVIEKADADDAPFYSGVAKIIMADQLGLAASYFGDIPYSEALKGTDVLQPKYDSQESVYAAVQTLLDQGIAEVSGGGYSGGDLIHGGVAAAWIKTANGLKARYYMHTSKRNNGDYAKAGTAAAAAAASNADNANFAFGTSQTDNWSLAKFGQERPSTLGFDPRFAAMLDGDPRLATYAAGGDYFQLGNSTLLWSKDDAVIPLMSYAEVKFIQAEVAAKAGGNASAPLSAAIKANMAMNGIATEAADAYVAAHGTDGSLTNVLTEAYKAYYGYNFAQTWANWRRTGIPALTPTPNASSGLNPSGVIPRRFLYVDSELQTNGDNVDAARAAQGGGLLDVSTWAFQ